MKELMGMWKSTRMVVLCALSAAVYVALLIPFKALTLIPGFAEIRPAVVLPVVCSLLFGPAAAWGTAIGNLIGDFFGTFGIASIFGFLANFVYGYLPYRIWDYMGEKEPRLSTGRGWVAFVIAVFISSAACAATVGWGTQMLGFFPFSVLADIILVNNFILSLVLVPVILKVTSARIRKWGLYYPQLVEGAVSLPRLFRSLGLILLVVGIFGAFFVGHGLISKVLPGVTLSARAALTASMGALFLGLTLV